MNSSLFSAITASSQVPALVAASGERASVRFLEFFATNIRNPHTRRAYYRAAAEFLTWCASAGVPSIAAVQPVHVATWIEMSGRALAAPSVKQPSPGGTGARNHIGDSIRSSLRETPRPISCRHSVGKLAFGLYFPSCRMNTILFLLKVLFSTTFSMA
jgi:hypothetical protein